MHVKLLSNGYGIGLVANLLERLFALHRDDKVIREI